MLLQIQKRENTENGRKTMFKEIMFENSPGHKTQFFR